MSVGLYDLDMAQYKTTPPNLELMKYATYYKSKREIVTLSPSFIPDKFTTFILRKDYRSKTLPGNMNKYDNLIYGGHGFSGDRYIPLEKEIESVVPDTSIYEKMRLTFGETKYLNAAFNVMMNASHFRLSLDGRTVWPDYEKQLELTPTTRTLFLHDYNIDLIAGGREELEKIYKKVDKGAGYGFIAMKFPVICNTYEDLVYWCKYKSTGNFFNVEYRGPLDDEELYDFICQQDLRSNPSKIDYIVTAKFKDQQDFLIRGLPQIYNQVLFLRRSKTKILLKYEQNFFIDKRWERVIDLMNSFMSCTVRLKKEEFNRFIEWDCMFKFVKSFNDTTRNDNLGRFNKQEARELFNFVREQNYEVFKYFYEARTVKLEGGKFINDAE